MSAMSAVGQHASYELYDVFVNALSFTLALDTIQTYNQTHSANLVLLCLLLALSTFFIETCVSIARHGLRSLTTPV